MDSLINNDTHNLHWSLEFEESRRLLRVLFPDHELFQRSMDPPVPSRAVPGQPPLDLFQVIEMLRKTKHYGPMDGDPKKSRWLNGSMAMESESHMAKFLNSVMDTIEEVVGRKFKRKQ